MNSKKVYSGFFVVLLLLVAPTMEVAHAEEAVASYDSLVAAMRRAGGNTKALIKATVGKQVHLNLATANGSYFFVKAADQTFFTCDTKAAGFKGGAVTARITGYFETEGDSNPAFKLDSCASAASATATTAAPRTEAALVWRPQTRETAEFKTTVPAVVVGKLTREKDPGGWKFQVTALGKKPVRVVYEGSDTFSTALNQLDDAQVSVSGAVGTFPGGAQAFDTRQQITVSRAR